MNFYNDIDPAACAWIRELITFGLIPDGVVDERSITEINPDELHQYKQCHFFAGVSGWPLALSLAGVSPDEPLWSMSCPCQPFSVAGKGKGTADERHLWPAALELIRACKPPIVYGEQTASKDARAWLAGVFADLEELGYNRAGADLCSAGVGAPNIRQRLYWVADAKHKQRQGCDHRSRSKGEAQGKGTPAEPPGHRADGRLGDTESRRLGKLGHEAQPGSCGHADGSGGIERVGDSNSAGQRQQRGTQSVQEEQPTTQLRGDSGGLADMHSGGLKRSSEQFRQTDKDSSHGDTCREHLSGCGGYGGLANTHGRNPGAEREQCGGEQRQQPADYGRAFWDDSTTILCADGKHRRIPAQPLLQPMAHGLSPDMGNGGNDRHEEIQSEAKPQEAAQGFPLADPETFRLTGNKSIRPALLKGAGNAINPEVAAQFIRAHQEVRIQPLTR